jgi:iron complex outermembrane receptor protein
MRGSLRCAGTGLIGVLACFSASVRAQDRSTDNAITQAEDAFGFSVGRESLGIYNADNARGFSPTEAGNVRIDGLYFDPAAVLTTSLVDSVSIRVGLSAQGYPFAAPSGMVDQTLRKPAAKAGASLIANFDRFGSAGIELSGSAPLTSRLGIAYGLTGNYIEFSDGTDAWQHSESIVAQWRAGAVQIVPFWSLFNDIDDESSTLYIPAGPFLPKLAKPRRFEGPSWTGTRYTTTNHGVMSSVAFSRNTILRLGAFRSVADRKRPFTNLFDQEQPDATGERITIADRPSINRALSGELRLTHSIAEGPRLHVVHLSIRARDAHRQFGGSDVISHGIGRIGDKVETPEPNFQFGPLSRDSVRQLTYGLAYTGRWKDRGEIGFGISRASFRKTTTIPGVLPAELQSHPWLYNANAAVNLTSSIVAYAGYARGLEESGVAPANAANRNQPLPVILTEQKDAGLRFDLTNAMKAVVGIFDLSRPYFGYEAGNIYTKVGTTRSRGVEFSLSGQVTPRLNLVAGGVILRPRVTKDEAVEGVIGSKPVGLPGHDFSLNANWQTPILDGLELDVAVHHRGRTPATTDNAVFLPARAQIDVGTHYRFRLGGKSATLRLQVANLFDQLGYGLGGSGVYWRLGPRYVSGYLTVDM